MKAFVHILEVFLAITLIYVVLNSAQISMPSEYSGPANLERLHRYAQDISFSLCNNENFRGMFVENALPVIDLNQTLPEDLDYHVYLYARDAYDSLSILVNDTGSMLLNKTIATCSCITSAYAPGTGDFRFEPKKIVTAVWSR